MRTTGINATGVHYVRDHLNHVPRPDRQASQAVRQWFAEQGHDLDPDRVDVVTLHYRSDHKGGSLAEVRQCVSLTQAVLSNWQGESNNDLFGALFRAPWAGTLPESPVRIVNALPARGFNHYGAEFSVFNGLFHRTEPARYDATTHVPIAAESFQQFIENLDFQAPFKNTLHTYWRDHMGAHRLACKLNFIAACNKQVSEGSLSEAARKLLWQAADLMPRVDKLRMSTLSIYGYAATDLLYLCNPGTDLTVLYIPGNSSPLLEFASENTLKDWIGEQCKDPLKREALKQHFRLADRPQGVDFSGLDTALDGLAEYPRRHALPPEHGMFNNDGIWPPRTYVNYRPSRYNPRITGDLFQALAERQRQRSFDDADFIITSDSQVSKAKWRGYLLTTLNLLAPLCLVVPGLAPVLALGGIAQLGLGLDEAINGKTLQARQDGVANITWGLFNAVPLLLTGAAKASALFAFKSDGFVPPIRLNDQIGYPMSPVRPPVLLAPAPEGAPYFHICEPIPPLPQADPLTADAVIRRPRYNGMPDTLESVIDDYIKEVVYDLERDAFILDEDINDVEPVGYVASPDARGLVPEPRERVVTDAMRTATLRALGIDLVLPGEIPRAPANSLPIPKRISCLWVGDKTLRPALLSNLAHNVAALENSDYSLRLFLSTANPGAHEENLRLLAEQAPGLQVLPLEEQAFFRAFQQTKYYAQYDAALDGNGGVATNYASASDVLRYPLLHHEGGLYMDVDDTLRVPGKAGQPQVGEPPATPTEAIQDVALCIPADGLLLAPPMANEKLSMNCLYNTSQIGSHPGNPTLEAISEEMHARFRLHSDFYDHRPSLAEDPSNFYRYASRLSYLTGPRLLSDVIDQQLPNLATLRQMVNLYNIPRINTATFINTSALREAVHQQLPLNRIATVGGNHSWVQT
ncbi:MULTISPECIES: dermonecrotic toxin domain-containing protein [Pseudomonas]|uniref:Mannosyltransferase n=2 Tax=Gammaproteobacteria TaxID=1236 RepID=A0A7W2LP84_9PSED|nr:MULTISPECIES: DUF6543 domain-containing protein [Pseudomonas]OAK61732.1 mannosyltransferase [Pseudomonas putida]PPB15998.1 mannosyltransferase [Pseudomonas aeruginosa]EGC00305.1 mannosyltransferase [Pseudomonas sp. TJI-51]MBA6144489.1 mannosyltransferase [Pseudomonas juntendi]MCL8330496.1 mannosyltransferase [Pseudomonas juntendi]